VEVKASPAPTTVDGTVLWYNTGDDILYMYDLTRAKWLSLHTFEIDFLIAAGAAGTDYFDHGTLVQITCTAAIGALIPWDCTLCEAYLLKDGVLDNANFAIELGGVQQFTAAWLAADFQKIFPGWNTDFDAADLMQIQGNEGTNILDTCHIRCSFRRRAS